MNIIITKHRSYDTIALLRAGVREIDQIEWGKASGLPLHASLAVAIKFSKKCRVAYADGQIVAMWGVTHDACLWLIATPAAEGPAGRAVQRHWKKELQVIQEAVPNLLLWCVPYERNALHLKWLKLLGFSTLEEEPDEEGFRTYIRNEVCVTR